MTTDILRPGYSNISNTEDQCAFSGVVMSTEFEVSIEKKEVFHRMDKRKSFAPPMSIPSDAPAQ